MGDFLQMESFLKKEKKKFIKKWICKAVIRLGWPRTVSIKIITLKETTVSSIKLVTLGGVRENGKNLYVAEVNDSIFVLDAGLKYPENEQLGVDVVIPNMDYLFENKDRIAGVFLDPRSRGCHWGFALSFGWSKVPVFGTELTIELAKLFVKSNDSVKKFNDFHVIDQNSEIDFGDAVVSFFKLPTPSLESIGIVIGTSEGNIVYTGDFKFDQTASEFMTDFARLAEIGREAYLPLEYWFGQCG